MNPEDARAYNSLAGVYKHTGKLKESGLSYQKAVRLDPADAEVHSNRGNLYQAMSKMDKARSSYEVALKINPRVGQGQVHLNLGIALGNLGLLEEAGSSFQSAIKMGPHLGGAYKNLGLVRFRQGKEKSAKKILKKAVRLDPNDMQAMKMLSQFNLQKEL
eukprot:gnl/MRDRNA2_/MRDRNA2_76852_c0_seq1.p1 gnl/MRDRNA2_/MRDRNA2_76852_c0~~gnl/MRDRNA2_/MRDRNA2_76852_c0_seq1.p1  ORF type:complete len:174 (+),score=33.65 gnl/MRDRNA2_/MRDRNA2_76852_c0_seq1:45-524(+)